MNRTVAHVVREGGRLTEPFIAKRVTVPVPGFTSEQWIERGEPVSGTETVVVPSTLIAPGSTGARAFHHVPQLGSPETRNYRRVASARRPTLIHAHYLTTGVLVQGLGIPLVVSAYGFDVSVMPRRPLWRRAFRGLAHSGAIVLVEGPHMRELVMDLGFTGDRVRIVPIAVGHEALEFTKPDQPDELAPRLFAAGRFVPKKGLDLAIRALAQVRATRPGATLEIVGSGPMEGSLRELAASLGLAREVGFAGSQPRPAYLERLAAADLFLAPSVKASNGDSEGGAPTTVLDAQAVGTIVVGSTHADIPFLVRDGDTGYLAREGDADDLATTIRRALDDTARWGAIAAAARTVVERQHSDAALASGLGQAYEAALSR